MDSIASQINAEMWMTSAVGIFMIMIGMFFVGPIIGVIADIVGDLEKPAMIGINVYAVICFGVMMARSISISKGDNYISLVFAFGALGLAVLVDVIVPLIKWLEKRTDATEELERAARVVESRHKDRQGLMRTFRVNSTVALVGRRLAQKRR